MSGSQVNPFNQRRLQGDGELVEGAEDAGEGVNGGAVPQQGAVLVHPGGQGKLSQQGEPVGQEPIPAGMNTGWSVCSLFT